MRGLLVLLGVLLVPLASACPVPSRMAETEWELRPDFPLDDFARGSIGVVEPTWADSYLIVAYEILNGRPFDARDRAGLLARWNERLLGRDREEKWPGLERWKKVRARVTSDASDLDIDAVGADGWSVHRGCFDGAFAIASKTLEARISELGAKSPEVRDWLAAQDEVFAACDGVGPRTALDRPATTPRGRADRDYQRAAWALYSDSTDEAVERFLAISKDDASPWRSWGRYLAARALTRGFAPAGAPTPDMPRAEALLSDALRDPRDHALRPQVLGLLHRVQFFTRPEELLVSLSREIDEVPRPDTESELYWLVELLDLREAGRLHATSDLADWIDTMRSPSAEPAAHAAQRWVETSSPAWLVAALMLADPRSADTEPLLASAARIPKDSAAAPSVAREAARLLVARDEPSRARAWLDEALASETLPPSARNRLLDARLACAASLEDVARLLPRKAAGSAWADGLWPDLRPVDTSHLTVVSRAGARSLDELPLSMAASLVLESDPPLPRDLATRAALSLFVRAAMLHRDDLLAPLAQMAARDEVVATTLESVTAAQDPTERLRLGILAVGRLPGARPWLESDLPRVGRRSSRDAFRDNWWCTGHATGPPPDPWARRPRPFGARPFDDPGTAFLTPEQRAQASQESKTIDASGSARAWLGGEALRWARESPQDARVAEALHHAVRASRFVPCEGDCSSRDAFRALHRLFPRSEWARKTPYWY